MGLLDITWPLLLLRYFDLAMLIIIPSIVMYFMFSFTKDKTIQKEDEVHVDVNVSNLNDYKKNFKRVD